MTELNQRQRGEAMTKYNDGKWHGWNGEVTKPASVHSDSVIDYVWFDDGDENELCGTNKGRKASDLVGWSQVVKFRVVKEHKEPREFWQYYDNQTGQWIVSSNPPEIIRGGSELIHVREVTE